MIVRDYKISDEAAIRALHAQSGFEYELPDFETQNFAANKVVEDDGAFVAAAAARVTVEIYGFCDPTYGTPGMRLAALKLLHASIEQELLKQNIHTACAWLPPNIAKTFGRRLATTFNWSRATWPCFYRNF